MATAPLASQACKRLWTGFRPATLISYRRMFQLFLAFLVVVDLSLPGVTSIDILASMEYLGQSCMSPDDITNHMIAVRSMCIVHGVNTLPFRDQRIPLFTKYLKLNRSLAPKIPVIIDENLLLQIVTSSKYLHFPYILNHFLGCLTFCLIQPIPLIRLDMYVLQMSFFQILELS